MSKINVFGYAMNVSAVNKIICNICGTTASKIISHDCSLRGGAVNSSDAEGIDSFSVLIKLALLKFNDKLVIPTRIVMVSGSL